MTLIKRIERFGKRCLISILKRFLKPVPVTLHEFNRGAISKILLVRQDSRLGNLVLMSPLVSGLRAVFPDARIDILISEGLEEVYRHHPCVGKIIVFRKKKARMIPWWYPQFIRELKKESYDLAVDVSNGYHFSLNNTLLTSLSGARYRLGYERKETGSFFNLEVTLLPEDAHMTDAMLGLIRYIAPDVPEQPMSYYISEDERAFGDKWLNTHQIREFDSFFAIHPGGRGRKQWGPENFAALIDRITAETQVRIVVIGGKAEEDLIEIIRDCSNADFDLLTDVTVGEMAAVIERCDMFISNDTGPIHVSCALGRPSVGIFISSDYRVYGPRGLNGRIVIGSQKLPSVDDVMIAVQDLLCSQTEMELDEQ